MHIWESHEKVTGDTLSLVKFSSADKVDGGVGGLGEPVEIILDQPMKLRALFGCLTALVCLVLGQTAFLILFPLPQEQESLRPIFSWPLILKEIFYLQAIMSGLFFYPVIGSYLRRRC